MKLADHAIAEQTHQLLEGVGEEALGLLATMERHLTIIGAPDISWEVQSVDTGLLRALSGRVRDFLAVDHAKLTEYHVLVSARAYGTALMVTWMLTASPRLTKEIVRAMRLTADARTRHDIGAELDMFSLMDLNAFIAITRLALKKAVAELTGEGETDESGIPSETGWSPPA